MAEGGFRRIVCVKAAAGMALALLVLLTVFHLLVLTGVIPYNVVWAV